MYKCDRVHRILLMVAIRCSIIIISTEDTDYLSFSEIGLRRITRTFVAEEMLLLLRWFKCILCLNGPPRLISADEFI